MKGHVFDFILSLVLIFVLNYIRSLIPLFIGRVFSLFGEGETTTLPKYIEYFFKDTNSVPGTILLVAVALVITAIVRDLLNFWADLKITHVSAGVGYNMQTDFYHHIQDLPYTYLNQAETGDLIQRSISDINRVKRFFSSILLNMFSSVTRVITIAAQMLILDIKYSSAILIFIPILFLYSFYHFKKMQPIFLQVEEDEGYLTTVVQENYTGIRVVKAFANESHEISKFKQAFKNFNTSWGKIMSKMSTYWGFSDGFSYFMVLYSLGLAIIFSRQGLSLDKIISIFIFVQSIMWPTRALARQLGELTRSGIASARILEIVDEPTEYEQDKGHLKPNINGKIVFKDVSFQFSDSSNPTLKNINLEINAGETIALIGKTGSGKSTLVSLLNRMLDPTSGELLIDDIDITTIDKKHIRKQVGVVLQEPFLYSRTIAENIGIVLDKKDIDTIQNVAETASVSKDIERFEKGYDTIVGERGVTLSGGQKQRISIARMLVEKKPILVFDDSLSAVDTETDLKIRNALDKRQSKTTTIIITHRITTAMDADRIIVIDDGEIANIGTHDELITVPGLYQNIWNIQNYFSEEEEVEVNES